MDKSPFNSPSPQDSPRLSSFTQHHRPVIAVHSGEHPGPRGWGWGTLISPLVAWGVGPATSHQPSEQEPYCYSLPARQGSLDVPCGERRGLTLSLWASVSPFARGGTACGLPLILLPLCRTQITHTDDGVGWSQKEVDAPGARPGTGHAGDRVHSWPHRQELSP